MEETRKHKNHYFPSQSQNQNRKISKQTSENDTNNVDTLAYNSQKPVNFLFSNDNELHDNDSSDELES